MVWGACAVVVTACAGAAVVVAAVAWAGVDDFVAIEVVAGGAAVVVAAAVDGAAVVVAAAVDGVDFVGTEVVVGAALVAAALVVGTALVVGAGEVDATLDPDDSDSGDVVADSVNDGALGVLVGGATAGTNSVADGGTVYVIPGGAVASGSRSTTLADRSLNCCINSCFCCPSPMVSTWELTATNLSWACSQSPRAMRSCT